jgi:hypothetical protein
MELVIVKMENWLIVLLGGIGLFIIGFFIEPIREYYEEAWEYIGEIFTYLISFEWLSDIGEVFSNGIEAISNIGESPLVNVWFWAFYICLLAGVWYLPGAIGVADYTLGEKFLYTFVFFIVDWFIISHFQNS